METTKLCYGIVSYFMCPNNTVVLSKIE